MNKAAGSLFMFLAVLMSYISLEKVLLELVQKKQTRDRRTCRTSRFQQHCDSRGLVRCCRQAPGAVKRNEVTRHAAAKGSDLPPPSPTPTLTFAELFAKEAHLAALAASYTFSAQLYSLYLNIPVIGEGGTTFLFVFLKNPSSGLLK